MPMPRNDLRGVDVIARVRKPQRRRVDDARTNHTWRRPRCWPAGGHKCRRLGRYRYAKAMSAGTRTRDMRIRPLPASLFMRTPGGQAQPSDSANTKAAAIGEAIPGQPGNRKKIRRDEAANKGGLIHFGSNSHFEMRGGWTNGHERTAEAHDGEACGGDRNRVFEIIGPQRGPIYAARSHPRARR